MEIKKPIRLVLLGLDGVGKTTLGLKLAQDLNAVYFKDHEYKRQYFGNPDYTWHATTILMQLIPLVDRNFVFDRFFYDEYVYGKTLGRSFNQDKFNQMRVLADKQNFKIIYVYRSLDELHADELIDRKYVGQLEQAYMNLLEGMNHHSVYGLADYQDQLKSIVKYLNL